MSIADNDEYAKHMRDRKKLRTNELDMIAYTNETKETDQKERLYEFQAGRALQRVENMLKEYPFQYVRNANETIPTRFAREKMRQIRDGPGVEFDLGRRSAKFDSFKRILDQVLDIEKDILDRKEIVESSKQEMHEFLKKYKRIDEILESFDRANASETEIDTNLALMDIERNIRRHILAWKEALQTSIVDGDGQVVKFHKQEAAKLLDRAKLYDVVLPSMKKKSNNK